MKLLALVASLFFPPLGVLLGGGNAMDLILNIILTFLFWIPGVLHAWFVILSE